MPRQQLQKYPLGVGGFGSAEDILSPERPDGIEPWQMTISQASNAIRSGSIRVTDLISSVLAHAHEANQHTNACITIDVDGAMRDAEIAERDIKVGNIKGQLHGIPLSLKDNIDAQGLRTTCASALFADRIADSDAFVVQKLRQAGAIVLAKDNLQEFASGPTSVSSYFGPVKNPLNLSYCAGGSSGGSAAAVAAGISFGAIGTDTGGSVRSPASFCGVVGLKPTAGAVSIAGIFPLNVSLDNAGPIGRTANDVAYILDAISGFNPIDPYSSSTWSALSDSAADAKLSDLKIAVPQGDYRENCDPVTLAHFDSALALIADNVRTVVPMIPGWQDELSNLSLSADLYRIHKPLLSAHPDKYTHFTRTSFLRTIAAVEEGTVEQILENYIRSKERLVVVRNEPERFFGPYDLYAFPSMRILPWTLQQALERDRLVPPREGGAAYSNADAFNALGWPAVSLPCGTTEVGLSVGMPLVARPGQDRWLLRMTAAVEKILRGNGSVG